MNRLRLFPSEIIFPLHFKAWLKKYCSGVPFWRFVFIRVMNRLRLFPSEIIFPLHFKAWLKKYRSGYLEILNPKLEILNKFQNQIKKPKNTLCEPPRSPRLCVKKHRPEFDVFGVVNRLRLFSSENYLYASLQGRG